MHVGSSDEGNDTVTVGDDNKDAAASSLLYQHTHTYWIGKTKMSVYKCCFQNKAHDLKRSAGLRSIFFFGKLVNMSLYLCQ